MRGFAFLSFQQDGDIGQDLFLPFDMLVMVVSSHAVNVTKVPPSHCNPQ